MSNNWETKTLEDLCVIKTGKKDVNQGNPEGKYPFFTCARKHTFSDSYSFDCEAILIAGNGEVGICHYHNGKFEAYQRTYVLSDFAEFVDVQFLFYFVEGKLRDEFRDKKLGNSMPYIRVGMLKDIKVPIPPLSEQRRIVKILDEKFKVIEGLKKVTEAQIKYAKELFESRLDEIFSHKSAWTSSHLQDHIKFIDYRGRTPEKTKDGVRLITAKNIKKGFIQVEPEEFIARGDYKNWMTRGIPVRGDILFTTEAPLGNVAMLDTDEKVAFAQRTIIFQMDRSVFEPNFLLYLMLSKPFQDDVLRNGTGATVLGIKASLLKKISIFYPSDLSEQRKIAKELNNLSEKTEQLESIFQRKIVDGEELKKSYLEQAFAGKL